MKIEEAIEILRTAVGCCSNDIECEALETLVSALSVRHGHWIEVENPSYSPFDDTEEHLFVCSHCFTERPHKSFFCDICGTQLMEIKPIDDEFEVKTIKDGKVDKPTDEEVKWIYKKIIREEE